MSKANKNVKKFMKYFVENIFLLNLLFFVIEILSKSFFGGEGMLSLNFCLCEKNLTVCFNTYKI
jgi:hypothetical protein